MTEKCCAFTGHRPMKLPWRYDESDVHCIALQKVLAGHISELIQKGVTGFLSGMAEGADQYMARIVLDFRKENPSLKLHCILPCVEQDLKWNALAREQYQSILQQADSIVYVSRIYHKDCMLERNRFMVDHAATLLAAYNGEVRGGTAATVRYAKKLGRDIIIVDPVV